MSSHTRAAALVSADGALPAKFKKSRFDRFRHFRRSAEHRALLKWLFDLFPYRSKFVKRHVEDPDRNWFTDGGYPLGDSDLVKAICLESQWLYGCRFGYRTAFAVIDIDVGSAYHNVEHIDALRESLNACGLFGHIVYRSSDSGGYHIYLPFDRTVACDDLAFVLHRMLADDGWQIRSGQLELYPPRNVNTQALRLPLQYGWSFLNQQTLESSEERYELSAVDALNYLFNDFSECTNSHVVINEKLLMYQAMYEWEQLPFEIDDEPSEIFATGADGSNTTDIQKGPTPYNECGQTGREDGSCSSRDLSRRQLELLFGGQLELLFGGHLPRGMDVDRWSEGRQFWMTGLTAHGQRDFALKALSHYLFYGDPSREVPKLGYELAEERAAWMKWWLQERHNGFSNEINKGCRDAYDQIDRLCHWRPRASRTAVLGPSLSPYQQANEKSAKRKQQEIKEWAETLEGTGVKNLSQFHRLTGIRRDTLRKYRYLWEHLLVVYRERNSTKPMTT